MGQWTIRTSIAIVLALLATLYHTQAPLIALRCPPGNGQETSYNNTESCAAPPQLIVRSVSDLWIGMGAFININRDDITAASTFTIAIFTLTLSWSTRRLWQATKAISQHAERALISTERAFVFGKGFQAIISIWDGAIREYCVFVTWENVGKTPALDVRTWIDKYTFPMNEDREPHFSNRFIVGAVVLGPSAISQSAYTLIPLETMIQKWRGETEIYVWSRIEYRDIFNPQVLHHHEQCACVELIHEPSSVPPHGHPPYVRFPAYGRQNTTS